MAGKYKKLWMLWSEQRKAETGSGFVTWEECGRVGKKQVQTTDAALCRIAAEGAKARYPDALPSLETVRA